VVANAKITLKDAVSGSTRDTVTDGDGYFTFASVPVGTYALAVTASGFELYKADGISLGGGEQRNLNVSLTVGAASQTVEVNAADTAIATTDSGEKSFTLETKELENFTQVGSNAAEYIKIVPGFGISNGTSNKSNYNGQTIGINANGYRKTPWTSLRTARTFPIPDVTATRRSTPTPISSRNSRS
jgi:hypothetical protein